MQRQNFVSLIRVSRVLSFSLLAVMLGGLLKPEAAVQPVSFGPKTDFATGVFPASVAVGDFNGDGKLDLAVANFASNTVSTLLGTGTGSFGAKTDFVTGIQPSSVAVRDFNGDGKLDLGAANFGNNTVSILLGTGAGTFGVQTSFGTGTAPFSVAVGDFNGDVKQDLATANNLSATVSILLNTCPDTESPSITCPANITSATNQGVCAPPGSGCQVATFAPSASDNFPGVTTMCTPPSGSCFPVGTTTVTCTATDASGNTASCSFAVTTFDVCLQDDSNPATVLLINSQTGDYRFCCGSMVFTGRGTITVRGCTISLQHNPGDRRLAASVDKSIFRGSAALQFPPGVIKCTITDTDTRNNGCLCP